MMKNGIFLLLCTVFVAACGSKDGGGGGNGSSNGTVATTALDSCFNGTNTNPQACNAANYGQYSQYGFRNYGRAGVVPTNWQGSGYYTWSTTNYNPGTYGLSNYAAFCSCASGTRPVFMPTGGLGCLQSTYFQNFVGLAYYGMDSSNRFVFNAQFSSIQGYNYSGRSCYQAVARACNMQANDCGGGLQCLPTVNGSSIGICATGVANNGYGGGYGRGGNDGHGRGDRDGRYDRDDRYDRDSRGGTTYSSSGSISGGGNR